MRCTPKLLLSFLPVFCFILYSCGVKNYPKETPFVYDNKIEVAATDLKGDSLTLLKDRLKNQMADSMQTRVRETFVIFKKLINPPAFDSAASRQSARNMEIYLKTIGYYNGKAVDSTKIDTVHANNPAKKQYRAVTTFFVNTGPVFRINEVDYFIDDSTLRQISCGKPENSLLKKGIPFTEQLMVDEIDRLVELYRNRGYYKISREQLYVDVDTVFLPLLNPLLDPFERILVLQEAKKRRENPVINVYIRTRPKIDSTALTVYKVGAITVYPDYGGAGFDSSAYKTTQQKNITVKARADKFKPPFLASNIYLQPGSLYKLTDLNRTLDQLNNLGAWQFIKVEPRENFLKKILTTDTPKIDFDFLMVPAKKYVFSTDLESVFNQVQQAVFGTAGNLIGVGLNLSLRNRNFAKQAVQSTHTIRFGVEGGVGYLNSGLQAIEFTYSNSFSIPKISPRFMEKTLLFLSGGEMKQKRTFISNSISYIDRNINNKGLYDLTNINSTIGWQTRTKKDKLFTLQLLNVEYVRLYNLSDSFQVQLDQNPFLKFSFSQGLVMGLSFSVIKPQIISKRNPYHVSYIRYGFEESGAIFGRLKSVVPLFRNELFEYVRGEVEVKHQVLNRNRKTYKWVFRAAAGAGYLYGDSVSMPFFKQFTGGGPNSMRAWPLRSIGPGARPLDVRGNRGQFFSRSGDLIFEANAEYRFDIVTVIPNTFVLRGALFTDVGNVWNFRNKSNIGNDTVVLQLKNFYRDLSVTAGSGFRLDFVGLFLLRFDFGLRIKNPSLPFSNKNSGWRIPAVNIANVFGNKDANRQWRYENFNFSLGINYPF